MYNWPTVLSLFPAWPAFAGHGGGVSFLPGTATRVVVFIDYKNLYHGARELFGTPSNAPPMLGNFFPLQLGQKPQFRQRGLRAFEYLHYLVPLKG